MAASEFSFPSPYDKKNHQKRKTAIEFRIMRTSQLIRERKGWREDMKSGAIINSWREEAEMSQGLKTEEFHCVQEQLKYYDGLTTGLVEVAAVDGTWQADNLVCERLKSQFMEAVNDLLCKPDKKDYEPGADNLVVNLIDPSLYCSVSGVTRVKLDAIPSLVHIGGGTKLEAPEPIRCSHTIPVEYNWLPAEFHINATGQVTISSYINNLHPINDRRLYRLIAKIFECFIPLLNGVLNDMLHLRPTIVPNPSPAKKRKEQEAALAFSTKYDLTGRDIQVIVKMKLIELTPEKPEFKCGDWHIEGIESECIVATGIYCYHTENITESRLYFRQNRGKYQESGSIVTCEDRLLAFPNIYQHRINSFELVDKTKLGCRKILVFFLVDPTKPIMSTRNVPPQQMSWFNEELQKIPPFDQLDLYIVNYITSFLEWPMSTKEAKSYREKLNERKTIPDGIATKVKFVRARD